MKNESLLEKAQSVESNIPRKSRGRFDQQQLAELAIAYFRGTVSYTAASLAMYGHRKGGTSVVSALGAAFRRAAAQGQVKVVEIK